MNADERNKKVNYLAATQSLDAVEAQGSASWNANSDGHMIHPMDSLILAQTTDHIKLIGKLQQSWSPTLASIVETIVASLRAGGKVLLAGNGGSAADAQHIAGEFVGRYRRERAAMAAIALSTDTSILTCIGNDYGFDRVFVRQVEALASPGDVLWLLSTSGNSANILAAAEAGRKIGARIIAFTGGDGGKLAPLADVALVVPDKMTGRIQEAHMLAYHIVCDLVEAEMRGTTKED